MVIWQIIEMSLIQRLTLMAAIDHTEQVIHFVAELYCNSTHTKHSEMIPFSDFTDLI